MLTNIGHQGYTGQSQFSYTKTLADSNNHKFKYIKSSKIIINNLKKDCVICMGKINENLPVKQLSCFHIYHADCLTQWFAVKGASICPQCNKREVVDTYANHYELIKDLPQKCTQPFCTLISNESNADFTANICPYPLATFPHQKPNKFLETNQEYIIKWLAEEVAQKKSNHDFKAYYTEQLQGSEFKQEVQGQTSYSDRVRR